MENTELVGQTIKTLPKHVGIIMDGNGRWAQLQGKNRVFGHKAGVSAVRSIVSNAAERGVDGLTLFAFSSENWQRPQAEITVLMDLFMLVLTREVKRLHKNNIRFCVVGDVSRFSTKLQEKIRVSEKLTQDNSGMVLSIAANYGGRWDIQQATKKIITQVVENKLTIDEVTEDIINENVCLAELPELDLLIRTGGDCRISNFLLWQSAYAELYFTDVMWPDFDEKQFEVALIDFDRRQRRYGKTGDQVKAQP